MSTPAWLRSVGQTLKDNSPSILSGIAAAGVIGTVVLAVKTTPKALKAMDQAREDKQNEEYKIAAEEQRAYHAVDEKLTVQEIVNVSWRLYVPAAVAGVATMACIFGSSSISNRRNAAMIGAYTLVDTAFREYKDKVIEQIGAARENKVTDSVAADHIEKNPISGTTVIITGSGDHLCHDAISGRYFRSDIEKIRRSENALNSQILADMWASLNDFYTLLGLDHIPIGETIGWNTLYLLELKYSSHLTDTGDPVLAIEYQRLPFAEYSKF